MKCEEARRIESARLDGIEADVADVPRFDAHIESCDDCLRYRQRALLLRGAMRAQMTPPPPLYPLRETSRFTRPVRKWVAVAAAGGLALGWLIGGIVPQESDSIVAGFTQNLAAQLGEVEPFSADVAVVERGWHPDVPERRFSGSIGFAGPDSAAVVLVDETIYPSANWVKNDVTVVVDGAHAWSSATRPCPSNLLPGCAREPLVASTNGRSPFSSGLLVASDLVVSPLSFASEEVGRAPDNESIPGNPLGLRMSVAQARPLLGAILPAGNFRDFHPADTVDVWLDPMELRPILIEVRPAEDPARRAWAATHGYRDGLEVILAVTITPRAGDPVLPSPPPAYDPGTFRPTGRPSAALAGLGQWRQGWLGGTLIETWARGAAWLRIERTATDDPPEVEGLIEMTIGSGFGYFDAMSRSVVGFDDGHVFVATGSLALDDLAEALNNYGMTGRRLAPSSTAESVGLRLGSPAGFGPSTIWGDGSGLTEVSWGGGDRVIRLRQRSGSNLPPPIDPAATGVEFRSTVARYSAEAGTLEWVEDDVAYRLDGVGLSLRDLVSIGEQLVR